MKRPIKFRGRVPEADKLDGGKVVFGSLVDYGKTETNLLCASSRFWINPIGGDRNFPVEENSIAQLVGYDKDGNEVYEGDTLIDQFGFESQAWLAKSFHDDCKLKEAVK